MLPGFLIKFAAGIVGPRFASVFIYGILAALLIGGFFGLKSCYDSSVVENARVKGNEKIQRQVGAADSTAADARADNGIRTAHEQAEIEGAVKDAKANGGDPRRAYYDCIRLQQQARKAGSPTPSCSGSAPSPVHR